MKQFLKKTILSKQSFEIVFGDLIIVTHRMLYDHLKEGKSNTKTSLLEKDALFLSTIN